eukprot:scaffold1007_cov176-Amphora_coffeaeformis.AAC.4
MDGLTSMKIWLLDMRSVPKVQEYVGSATKWTGYMLTRREPVSICSKSPKTGGKLGVGGESGGPIGDPFPQHTGCPVSVSVWFGLEGGDKILTRMGGESLGRVLPYKITRGEAMLEYFHETI